MKFIGILLILIVFISCSNKNEIGYISGSSMNNFLYDKYINEVKVELNNDIRSDIAEYDSRVIELFYNYNKTKEDIRYRKTRKGL